MTGKDFDTLNEAYATQVKEGLPMAVGKAVVSHMVKNKIKDKLKKDKENDSAEEAAKPDYI